MAKEKDRRPVHLCVDWNFDTRTGLTACGLKLDRDSRKDVVLTTTQDNVTCQKCKEKK